MMACLPKAAQVSTQHLGNSYTISYFENVSEQDPEVVQLSIAVTGKDDLPLINAQIQVSRFNKAPEKLTTNDSGLCSSSFQYAEGDFNPTLVKIEAAGYRTQVLRVFLRPGAFSVTVNMTLAGNDGFIVKAKP